MNILSQTAKRKPSEMTFLPCAYWQTPASIHALREDIRLTQEMGIIDLDHLFSGWDYIDGGGYYIDGEDLCASPYDLTDYLTIGRVYADGGIMDYWETAHYLMIMRDFGLYELFKKAWL